MNLSSPVANNTFSNPDLSFHLMDFEDDATLQQDIIPVGEGSLVAGAMPMYFRYNDITFFDNTGYMAMLGSPKSNILVGYVDNDDLFTHNSLKTVRVNLQLGGNAYLWRNFLRLPLSIYVPIRLNAGYQYLSLNIEEEMDLFGTGDDKMNFLNVNFGAGLGASFRFPLDNIPLLGSHISLDGYLLRSPGVMINFIAENGSLPGQSDSDNEVGVSVSNDLLIQARIHRFLESTVGVTAGIRFSALNWSTDSFDFSEAANALVGDDIPDNRMDFTSLFIGFNW